MRKSSLLIASGLCLLAASCAGKPQTSGDLPEGMHPVKRLIVANLQVRRPSYPPADPDQEPHTTGYQTAAPPNEDFSCTPWRKLFAGIALKPLRSCLEGINAEAHVLYRLAREDQPRLDLVNPQDAPPCLAKTLPSLPAPREIVFQSNEKGSLSCYSSRLDVEGGRVLGVKLPIDRVGVSLTFPLIEDIRSDEELRLTLLSWVLTPFMHPLFQGKLLPEVLCERCMGKKQMLRDSDPPPALWPR